MESKSLLLNSTITEAICSNLTFEEAVQLRDALSLPTLDCPIPIIDPKTSKTIFLPGVNLLTIKVRPLISKYGLDGALIEETEIESNEMIQLLLKIGANIKTVDQHGRTSLMLASANGSNEVVKTLLEGGANVHDVNAVGWTVLMIASMRGHSDVVKTLLENGANTETVDKSGRTALLWAVDRHHTKVVKTLLEGGANIEYGDQGVGTAYMWSSMLGYNDITEMLLEAGANPNATDRDGNN